MNLYEHSQELMRKQQLEMERKAEERVKEMGEEENVPDEDNPWLKRCSRCGKNKFFSAIRLLANGDLICRDCVENPKMWTIDELDKEIDKTTKYLEKLWSARNEKK